jgi:uncharacterized hydrophobic protein (TIGR00271 family)
MAKTDSVAGITVQPDMPPARQQSSRSVRKVRAWHRRSIVDGVDRPTTLGRVHDEAGWSSRYAFMVMMSAGIAILGLLLSSPAVVIGAMLISPLMGPIIGLGFALATFDWIEVRKSLIALALGTILAVGFTALVVRLSPLQDITPEILARTRPNLFDLLVAIFSALAGSYATVRGRGETIVGVAIATALMPPLAVVGFGVATGNGPIFLGALALYVTNFIAIALSATAVARFYGFGSELSPSQSRRQGLALALVLLALAVPLAISLRQIAWEAWATRTARNVVEREFGPESRVSGFDPNFAGYQVRIRTTVFTDRYRDKAAADLERRLSATLQRPVTLRLSQIVVNDGSQRAELDRARSAAQEARSDRLAQADLAARLSYISGATPGDITIDTAARRAIIMAGPDIGLADLQAMEQRARRENPEWDIRITPPLQALPPILFPAGSAAADADVEAQTQLHLWALERWGAKVVAVSGGRATDEPARLAQQRVDAARGLLASCGYRFAPDRILAPDRAAETEFGRAQARAVQLIPDFRTNPGLDDGDAAEPLTLAPCIRGLQAETQPAESAPADAPASQPTAKG